MGTLRKNINISYSVSLGDTEFLIDFDLQRFKTVLLQINYINLDTTDATFSLERKSGEVDRFVPISNSTTNLNTGTGQANDYQISPFGAEVLKVIFKAGTATAGTIENIQITAKE